MIKSKDWEKDIFSKGKQLNNWPNSDLVAEVKRIFPNGGNGDITILEIGFGTGNNLRFFEAEGFVIKGLEYSKTAINYARECLNITGKQTALVHGSVIDGLPWIDNSIDIVVDRGCLTQLCFDDVLKVISEIYRVLKVDGHFLSFTLLGRESDDLKYGVEVSKNTFDFFSEGYFSKNGLTSVYDSKTILSMLSKFNILKLDKLTKTDVLTGSRIVTYTSISKKID